uniref:Cysteine desulfurase-like protein n=1 Tax=Thermogemmatispora argillosa TaxID=2045280 RepID=A0A455T8L5_9CHLR|nr:cysteine desulfurase-like protein [Thermogemmatispora argillosa]
MTAPLDLSAYRRYFPALQREQNGQPVIYWDNPGGTQVAQQVIEAMTRYLREANANAHGAFLTSRLTDEIIAAARQAMADFLNAASPAEIVFGPNMTTLTFAFSRAIGKTLQPGDEIIVTVLDHDANVAPWLALQERGVVVRTVDIHPENVTLNMEDLQAKLNGRTRLVAVGYASNAVGTINDVRRITELAHAVGALVWIDAVQYAPHGPIDVQALDVDFLVCSAYKFFGPHLGILYGKREHLERFPAYKVRPASNAVPDRWETGTQNHEGLAGLLGAIDYLTLLGEEQAARYADDPALQPYTGRRRTLKVAMHAISDYERQLSAQLLRGLREIRGLHLYGLGGTTPGELAQRVPTVACTIDGHHPRELAAALGERGIFAWDGNYYALGLMERLGLEGRGGALRLGLCHYNTPGEIERVLGVLDELV